MDRARDDPLSRLPTAIRVWENAGGAPVFADPGAPMAACSEDGLTRVDDAPVLRTDRAAAAVRRVHEVAGDRSVHVESVGEPGPFDAELLLP